MKAEIAAGRFLTGAMYAPFCRTLAAPMEEWDSDFKKMAECGFTCAHGFAEWHDIEYEKGKFDFTAIDHMVDCAHRNGIVPIINIATQNSVGFYSPRWLMEEFRGTGRGFVDSNDGQMVQGQYTVPCIDDPVYGAYARRYLAAVARHFAGDERVGGYVLWGEPVLMRPGHWEAAICYCEHTVRKFRGWLRQRYGNIEALNAAWCTEGPSDYIDFEQVCPPTGACRQLGGFVSWDDFREFMEQNLADHIKAADRIFKENGAMQPTICEMLTGIHNSIDSWKLAQCTDIIGTSCFERPGRISALYMSMADSMAKALDKTTFGVEASGASVRYMGVRSPSANELCTTLLQRAAHGVRGLMYWTWRPRLSDTEGNDFGMVRPDGKVLPKTRELGERAAAFSQLYPIYERSQRTAQVAIFSSQSINHLMDHENMTGNYINALIGANYMMQDLHVNADFICEKEILRGSLQKYRVLLLPCSYILSPEAAAEIEQFVKNGGLLIADYLLADKMPGGICYMSLPGGGLDRVFGIERDDILLLEHKSQVCENSWGARINSVLELVSLTGAESLCDFSDGVPLVTRCTYGKGQAVYICSQFFSGYIASPGVAMRESLLPFLRQAGIVPHTRLLSADAEEQSALITTALFEKAGGALSALTVSNTAFPALEETVCLPAGEWQVFKKDAAFRLESDGDESRVTLTLEGFESAVIYRR